MKSSLDQLSDGILYDRMFRRFCDRDGVSCQKLEPCLRINIALELHRVHFLPAGIERIPFGQRGRRLLHAEC